MTESSVPPPLSGVYEGSFAYKTIRDRLPAILVRVIDDLHKLQRQQLAQNGQDGAHSLKETIGLLSKLRYEMMTNKELTAVGGNDPDVDIWNTFIMQEHASYSAQPRWFQNSWLFVECYMYRKINEIIRASPFLQDYDQFRAQKNASLADSSSAVRVLLDFTHRLAVKPSSDDVEQLKSTIAEYFELSLWGNKCDLSISGGAENAQKFNPLDQLLGFRRFILVNDFEQHVWSLLSKAWKAGGSSRMDIVLDNAGFEVVADLALAEILIALGFTHAVYFHVKRMPWFVSDAMAADIGHTLEQLSHSPSIAMQAMGKRWLERVHWHNIGPEAEHKDEYPHGSFVICDDLFWTLPHDYAQCEATSPGLYADLGRSTLVIFKGDLNYRKLVGDRQWRRDTPFTVALRGFAPTSVLSLRTLKADVVVGMSAVVAESLDESEKDWMISGAYGIVQFCAATACVSGYLSDDTVGKCNGGQNGRHVSFVVGKTSC